LGLEIDLFGEKCSAEDWNPLHLAVYFGRRDLVRYFLQDLDVNPRTALMGPAEQEETKSGTQAPSMWEVMFPFPSLSLQCFSLALCINNKDGETLNYLLNEFGQEGSHGCYPLWNSEQVLYILKGAVAERWLDGVDVVLKGNCAQHVYLCMDYFQRLDFVGEGVGQHMNAQQDPLIKERLVQILAQFPYAGLSLSFLVLDESCPASVLVKALDQVSVDDLEQLYIYELENIPQTIKLLHQRGVDKALIRRVFDDRNKDLKDKEGQKLKFFEFIDLCVKGDLGQLKFFVKTNEPYSVNFFYGLRKMIRFRHRSEPATTKYFTPLLFSVFYSQTNVIDYLIANDMVNPFTALKEPPQTFVEEDEENAEELGISNDQWFSSCAIEIFALEIAIGMRNFEVLALLFSKFRHLWMFTHVYAVVELSVQRGDAETVEFVIAQGVFADTFEILEQGVQFKALQMMTTKPLEYLNDESKND